MPASAALLRRRACGCDFTAETSALQRSLEDMLSAAAGSPGVLKCEILAG